MGQIQTEVHNGCSRRLRAVRDAFDGGELYRRVYLAAGKVRQVLDGGARLVDSTQRRVGEYPYAQGGKMPGLALPVKAGSAVAAGVNAGASGVRELRGAIERDAERSAVKIAAQIRDFYVRQGWAEPSE